MCAIDDVIPMVRFKVKPPVKWAGGKRGLLETLREASPRAYGRYCEPFLGGGAFYLALDPEVPCGLSDINGRLIRMWKALRDDVEGVIAQLHEHRRNHTLIYFQEKRKALASAELDVEVAALFIYLNKTCYNGLYRVNRRGEFNVPIGNYVNPKIVDEENLRALSERLQGVELREQSFEAIEPRADTFYYLDPPYHQTYSQYDGSGFDAHLHERLAQFCRAVDEVGGKFMLSNSDTRFIRHLYKGFDMQVVKAPRFISCKGDGRGKTAELLIRNSRNWGEAP